MQGYKIITTVDITRSGAERDSTDYIATGQQSNFNTLVQTIGLRANIEWDKDPINPDSYWHWLFWVERPDIFSNGESPVALLEFDLHNVPVISNLTNTIAVYPPVFRTCTQDKNTWIEITAQ